MHAAILYQLTGEPEGDAVESHLGSGFPAVDADGTHYLDGKTLYHGSAAAEVEDERQVPVPDAEGINLASEEVVRRVHTEWYADLQDGWAGITSSDGEWFVTDYLLARHGVVGESLEIALDEWAEDFVSRPEASVWGVNYSEENEDGESLRAGSAFHSDASLEDVEENADDLSGVGFTYKWDGGWVRGAIFGSGYVSIFRAWSEERFARYLADHILPYSAFDAGAVESPEQSTLDGDDEFTDEVEQHLSEEGLDVETDVEAGP